MVVSFTSCKKEMPAAYQLAIPSWFPEMEIPADNQLTTVRIDLGRKLFYDPLLSIDTTLSCGSCHKQDKAFTDGLPKSVGVKGAVNMRNAPTLTNIGFAPYFFLDGGVETLELQSQAPIFSEKEMHFAIAGFLERIVADKEYRQMFEKAYDREPDAFGISRAIASFERTFISSNTRFDAYQYQNQKAALTQQEVRGKDLFFSKEFECAACHEPPLFTNYAFENVGLYTAYTDTGRARITHLKEDNGKFKVPTLRNIAFTAPYMHDGSLETLDAVMNHFSSGAVGHVNQSNRIKPLHFTLQEKADLIAFLNTLSDTDFINASAFAQ
ncbi:cytochrome-c peroxidase [Bacteroidota bacterium]